MVILPLNVEASFPKWFPDFVKFEFKYSNKLLEKHCVLLFIKRTHSTEIRESIYFKPQINEMLGNNIIKS